MMLYLLPVVAETRIVATCGCLPILVWKSQKMTSDGDRNYTLVYLAAIYDKRNLFLHSSILVFWSDFGIWTSWLWYRAYIQHDKIQTWGTNHRMQI